MGELDEGLIVLDNVYSSLVLCIPNVALAHLPRNWSLLMVDAEVVLFSEVNKQTAKLTRSVGFDAKFGKTNATQSVVRGHSCHVSK